MQSDSSTSADYPGGDSQPPTPLPKDVHQGEVTAELFKKREEIVHDWLMGLGLTEEEQKLLTVAEALALTSRE